MRGVTVLMMFAACYGVWQLTMLASATRTVRMPLLVLGVVAGLYGAGMLALGLQLVYTRGMAALTGDPLPEIVRTASYTVDPLIEELAKVAPFALLALLHRKVRAQWGLTDFLLLGAAGGAGFGLVEQLLRHADEAAAVTGGGPFEGWSRMQGFSFVQIWGLPDLVTSWLPTPVSYLDAFSTEAPSPDISLHLVWSALAGLGLGLLIRGSALQRLAGVALLLFPWLDHAAYNHEVADPDGAGIINAFATPLAFLRHALWLYPLLALAAATFLDRRILLAAKRAWPDTLTEPERAGRSALAALGGHAFAGLPWTPYFTWTYVLTRRAALFSHDRVAPDDPMRQAVAQATTALDATRTAQAWRGTGLRRRDGATPRRGIKPWLPLIVWAALLIPAVLYFLPGSLPTFSGVQGLLAEPWVFPLVLVFSVAGLAWLGWQLYATARRLRSLLAAPAADAAVRAELRLLTGFGSIAAGIGSLVLGLAAGGPDQPVLTSHILDAISQTLFLASLLLAMLAMVWFPPLGLAALAGGGFQLVLTAAAADFLATLAGAGALAILAAMMSGNGSGGRGDDYWEEKYGQDDPPPRQERISDANKAELEDSGWLKNRLKEPQQRRDFMKWLEQGHKQGEAHEHLRPGSPEAEAKLAEFLAEML
ncbi:hypothetical protein Cci01nite_12170 [Catellatospora citrea]|uniref:Protease prsW family protein n=1 Tax=Catellatospora citrea TaxID=53366 RepID=A0A8J3KFU6_9ACTN|nr:protease prsW family protein [Catellatospora citrea]GIF96123.1 hypothetical protein Cci01nite_12170 [Catellatospora citrea]